MHALLLLPMAGLLTVLQDEGAWRELQPPATRRDDSELWQLVESLGDLAEAGAVTVVAGDQNAYAEVHGGPEGLEIRYRFEGREGLEYVELATDIALPDPTPGLGLEFRGGAHPLPVRVRVTDSSGEVFQYTLGECRQARWQRGAAVLQPRADHWGGDGNGELDAPLRLASIVLDRARGQGFVGEGTVWLRGLVVCRREEGALTPHGIRIEVPRDREWLVYEPGEPVRLRVTLTAPEVEVGTALSASLCDPFGASGWESVLEGSTRSTVVVLDPAQCGHWDLRLRVAGMEEEPLAPWADFRFAVLEPHAIDPGGPLGVCTHFSQGWDPRVLGLLPLAGLGTLRDECSWGAVEPEPGELTIPDHVRAYVERSGALGVRPLIIADYGNRHYDGGGYPTSPEAIAAFARYAGFLASELGETVPFFEVWNEWTGGCGMPGLRGDPETYPPLFIATAEAIRSARPEATVIGVGGEYGGVEELARLVTTMIGQGASEQMDGFSIHPYQYPSLADAAYRERLVAVSEAADQAAGRTLPMWITEVGWPTHAGERGVDFLHQARCLVRMTLMSLTVPTVEKVIWYDLKDDGTDLNYNEHNFGLVHHDSTGWAPKPAFVALGVLARALAGRGVREWSLEGGLWRVPLEGAGGRLTVVWAEEGEVEVPVPDGARVMDMFGRPMAVEGSVGVGWDPVYIGE